MAGLLGAVGGYRASDIAGNTLEEYSAVGTAEEVNLSEDLPFSGVRQM